MPPLPFLPDDVLTEIISFLTPPPPLSMAPSPPTLLSEILEAHRPPDRSNKDLMAFWKTGKRFKALSDRSYHSYVVLKTPEACLAFAAQLHTWTRSNATPPSLVLGLTLRPKIRLDLVFTITIFDLDPIELIIGLLPNLFYLNLGGSFAPSPKLLGSLASYPLSLQSVVGLGLTPSNYNSILVFLRSVSKTLRYLHLVDIENMKPIVERPSVLNPPIELPVLRSLRLDTDVEREEYETVHHVVELKWLMPQLFYLVTDVSGILGDSYFPLQLLVASGRELVEFSCPLIWTRSEDSLKGIDVVPHLETLATRIDTLGGHHEVDESLGAHPQIRTLVALQQDTSIPVEPEEFGPLITSMRLFFSLSTFPNLERVYWITEKEGDHHFAWWTPIAMSLTKAGVEVICL